MDVFLTPFQLVPRPPNIFTTSSGSDKWCLSLSEGFYLVLFIQAIFTEHLSVLLPKWTRWQEILRVFDSKVRGAGRHKEARWLVLNEGCCWLHGSGRYLNKEVPMHTIHSRGYITGYCWWIGCEGRGWRRMRQNCKESGHRLRMTEFAQIERFKEVRRKKSPWDFPARLWRRQLGLRTGAWMQGSVCRWVFEPLKYGGFSASIASANPQ